MKPALRLVRWYQNLAEDHHPARHGRGSVSLYREVEVEKNGRRHLDEVQAASVHLEWAHLWRYRALGFKISTIGEETLDVHLHGIVFAHYWRVDLHRQSGRLLRLPRARLELDLTRHGLSWKVGDVPDWRPSKDTPKWRKGSLPAFRVSAAILGKVVNEQKSLAHAQAAVPLPENDYLVDLVLERHVRYRVRLPWLRKTSYFVDLKAPPPGLPFPDRRHGGADGIYGMSTRVRRPEGHRDRAWVASAVGDAVRRTLEYRARYGRGIEDSGLESAG